MLFWFGVKGCGVEVAHPWLEPCFFAVGEDEGEVSQEVSAKWCVGDSAVVVDVVVVFLAECCSLLFFLLFNLKLMLFLFFFSFEVFAADDTFALLKEGECEAHCLSFFLSASMSALFQ